MDYAKKFSENFRLGNMALSYVRFGIHLFSSRKDSEKARWIEYNKSLGIQMTGEQLENAYQDCCYKSYAFYAVTSDGFRRILDEYKFDDVFERAVKLLGGQWIVNGHNCFANCQALMASAFVFCHDNKEINVSEKSFLELSFEFSEGDKQKGDHSCLLITNLPVYMPQKMIKGVPVSSVSLPEKILCCDEQFDAVIVDPWIGCVIKLSKTTDWGRHIRHIASFCNAEADRCDITFSSIRSC